MNEKPTSLAHAHCRQVSLCADVVEDVMENLTKISDPDLKADILIQTERLALSTMHLLSQVRSVVWDAEPDTKLPPPGSPI